MGWNADGTFSRSYDWTDERDAGNNIDATKFDTENDTFATGIESCINKDGKNSPSTDLPMGGNKHTGVGDGSARNHYAALGQIQDGTGVWGGTAGGTATALTIAPSPAITAYAAGQTFSFLAASTNTGATTINVNSVGAKNVYSGGVACAGGEIIASQVYVVTYDGTQFNIVSGNALPACEFRVRKASTQTIANATATTVVWDTEDYDYGSNFSTSTFTAPVAGLYHLSASVSFDANSNGYRRVEIYDGSTVIASCEATANASAMYPVLTATTDYKLAASSTITVRVYQNSTFSVAIGNIAGSYPQNTAFTGHIIRRY